MYVANFSKEQHGFLDKKIYQKLSQSNVGKNFLEVYKEVDTKPKNQISNTLVDKSI